MQPSDMKFVEIASPGTSDGMIISRRAVPKPAPHEVLIKIHAAGVNGPDIMQRQGLYPPPKGASDIMGLEVSGTIVACGQDVARWVPGDQICALTNGGGYAEYVAVDAGHCLPIPDGVSLQDAAGLCETFFTVWSNLFFTQRPAPGSIFLVHGGAGGIGGAAIQLGSVLGLRVFTTCGTDEKCRYSESLGAACGINYKSEDFVEVMQAQGGAATILDIIGGDYVGRNFKAAAIDGRIVQLAFRAGAKVDVNLMPIMLKRLTLTGSTLRPRPPEFKAKVAQELEGIVWPMLAAKTIRTQTHATLPIEEVIAAHDMMEQAQHLGKIILLLE